MVGGAPGCPNVTMGRYFVQCLAIHKTPTVVWEVEDIVGRLTQARETCMYEGSRVLYLESFLTGRPSRGW